LFEAVQQAGYALTDDVNGYRQEGFACFDRNVHHGRRLSAAGAYLHPVTDRANLEVVTRATVMGVRFVGRRATGVEYRTWRGSHRSVSAGEVILCGGAFNTPQLLQVSGVGDGDHLRSVGAPLVHHLPGVGANLQDHLEVYVQHAASRPVSLNPLLAWHRRPWIGLQWLAGMGPGMTNHFEAGGFVRSNDDVAYPNLMFHFLPVAVRYDGTQRPSGHGYQMHVGPMYSDVRGTVRITSPDATVQPALQFNYLSTPNDRQEWIEAIEVARHILAQPAFAPYDGGEISPGSDVATDEEVLAWVAADAETALHPSCTCAMGAGDLAVVDPRSMRVHGLEGLRAVDASVMPYVTNGNIYAPVMMIAEKASDLILGNTPLEPEHVPFYRHRALT
jgi:choline dehydrogenase